MEDSENKMETSHEGDVSVITVPETEHAAAIGAPVQSTGISIEEQAAAAEIDATNERIRAAAETTDLKMRALLMQDELGVVLNAVKNIKDNCAKLKSENKSLQEYIESLMAKR